MIVQQVTPSPRFGKGVDGELCLITKLAAVFYAENADDEAWLRKTIEEIVK